jgi:hypothetical protein
MGTSKWTKNVNVVNAKYQTIVTYKRKSVSGISYGMVWEIIPVNSEKVIYVRNNAKKVYFSNVEEAKEFCEDIFFNKVYHQAMVMHLEALGQ